MVGTKDNKFLESIKDALEGVVQRLKGEMLDKLLEGQDVVDTEKGDTIQDICENYEAIDMAKEYDEIAFSITKIMEQINELLIDDYDI